MRTNLLRELFVVSRPISWVNTAFPFAAVYLLVTHSVDLLFVVGTLFFLVPYNLAMYGINDVFDYESDLLNARKGGVEGAVLDRGLHRATLWAVLVTNVPFLVYLIAVGNPLSWLVLAISMFAVVAYSMKGLRFKEVPFLDSVTSSTHFVSPAIYAAVLTGAVFNVQLVTIFSAYFLWGMASHAFGAVQDIPSDRSAGISSVATVMGARVTVRFALWLYALAGLLLLGAATYAALIFVPAESTVSSANPVLHESGLHESGLYESAGLTPLLLGVAALLSVPYLAMCWPYRNITDEQSETANKGWRKFIAINYGAGFVVTMLMIISALA